MIVRNVQDRETGLTERSGERRMTAHLGRLPLGRHQSLVRQGALQVAENDVRSERSPHAVKQSPQILAALVTTAKAVAQGDRGVPELEITDRRDCQRGPLLRLRAHRPAFEVMRDALPPQNLRQTSAAGGVPGVPWGWAWRPRNNLYLSCPQPIHRRSVAGILPTQGRDRDPNVLSDPNPPYVLASRARA